MRAGHSRSANVKTLMKASRATRQNDPTRAKYSALARVRNATQQKRHPRACLQVKPAKERERHVGQRCITQNRGSPLRQSTMVCVADRGVGSAR